MREVPLSGPDPARVLSKAVTRVAEALDIQKASLARILGISPATVSRLYQDQHHLDPSSKAGELGLLLVRLFRSLDSIVGTQEAARIWFASENLGLNGRPKDLVLTTHGLVHVTDYLDAHRARI